MKRCPYCAEEIQDAAILCKHCGRDLPGAVGGTNTGPSAKAPARKSGANGCLQLLAIVGGLVILGTSIVMLLPTRPIQMRSTTEAPLVADPEMRLTASELGRLYAINEVAADQRFDSQVVQTSGTVAEIGKDVRGLPYVTLNGYSGHEEVQAMFGRDQISRLAQITPFSSITVTCRGAGKLVYVQLRDCRF